MGDANSLSLHSGHFSLALEMSQYVPEVSVHTVWKWASSRMF